VLVFSSIFSIYKLLVLILSSELLMKLRLLYLVILKLFILFNQEMNWCLSGAKSFLESMVMLRTFGALMAEWFAPGVYFTEYTCSSQTSRMSEEQVYSVNITNLLIMVFILITQYFLLSTVVDRSNARTHRTVQLR